MCSGEQAALGPRPEGWHLGLRGGSEKTPVQLSRCTPLQPGSCSPRTRALGERLTGERHRDWCFGNGSRYVPYKRAPRPAHPCGGQSNKEEEAGAARAAGVAQRQPRRDSETQRTAKAECAVLKVGKMGGHFTEEEIKCHLKPSQRTLHNASNPNDTNRKHNTRARKTSAHSLRTGASEAPPCWWAWERHDHSVRFHYAEHTQACSPV